MFSNCFRSRSTRFDLGKEDWGLGSTCLFDWPSGMEGYWYLAIEAVEEPIYRYLFCPGPFVPLNSRSCQLRIDYLTEDEWGPQWRPEIAEIFIFRNILWPTGSSQIFITSRNIFVLLLILIVGSRIHYSPFASYNIPLLLIHKKDCGPTDPGIIT